ncbi:hypothetical protein GCM10009776_32160 [Microbacterium deminutum]|uniref:UbiC transcription regulator-associated domain-containing protein n=1 Tax=Microbacterium deminutum TaxID=344164 RepID=A0ABN2RBV0_9MICO
MIVGDRLGRQHGVRLHDAGPLLVAEGRLHEVAEQIHPIRDVLPFEPRDISFITMSQNREQELILRPEMMQNSCVGHPDLIGYVAECPPGVTLAAEDLDGSVEDLASADNGLGAITRLAPLDMHSGSPSVARYRNVVYSQFVMRLTDK